ncbi:MAG: hypothetical protein H0X70_02800 [Segetibacter sp.]|nr:hypothetical protein [Segetibacter sp.]
MESIYAVFDGEKFVTEKKIDLKKGQKIIVTILEEEIRPEDESTFTYATAVKSGAFNYLFQEGEEEYSSDDCKIKYK